MKFYLLTVFLYIISFIISNVYKDLIPNWANLSVDGALSSTISIGAYMKS
ncbi:hypothetical protein U3516DRAFT_757645 [Neocallimastix sp. 'constans']